MGISSAGIAIVTGSLGTTFYLALGTGSTAFAKAQTALVAESVVSGLARAAATTSVVTTTTTNDTMQCVKTFTSAGATTTVAEVGWFNASSGPTMMGRTVLGTTRTLVSGDQYTVTYKTIFA